MSLVNISKSDENPYLIHPESVTAIWSDITSLDTLRLTDRSGNNIVLSTSGLDDVVQKLADHGRPLISVTICDRGSEHRRYVAGDAIYFIATTQPEKDGSCGLIAGIEGYGLFESEIVEKEEIDALVHAMRASRKTLEYTPDFAHARWSNPGALYIDPTFVVKADSFAEQLQVNVTFKDHEKIDVQIWNEPPAYEIRMNRSNEEDEQAYQEAIKAVKNKSAALREQFFTDLSAHNPSLIRIFGQGMHCLDPSDISFAFNNDDSKKTGINMCSVKANGEQHPLRTCIFFNNAAERDRAMKTLARAKKTDAKPLQSKG